MKIKELIAELEKNLELHGDVDVKHFNGYWLELEDDCLLIKLELE